MLYLCLLVLTLLPISYLHSKMLFNSAFADTLSQVNNRRQLMGELYTLFTIRASSFYQVRVRGTVRGKGTGTGTGTGTARVSAVDAAPAVVERLHVPGEG